MYYSEHAPQLWRHPPAPPPRRRRDAAPADAGAHAAPLGRSGSRSPAGRVRTGQRWLQAAWDCSIWVFKSHTLLQGSHASLASSSTLPNHLAPSMPLLQGQLRQQLSCSSREMIPHLSCPQLSCQCSRWPAERQQAHKACGGTGMQNLHLCRAACCQTCWKAGGPAPGM